MNLVVRINILFLFRSQFSLKDAQMTNQNKIEEIGNVTQEITRYKSNKETSQKDRMCYCRQKLEMYVHE